MVLGTPFEGVEKAGQAVILEAEEKRLRRRWEGVRRWEGLRVGVGFEVEESEEPESEL